MKNFKFFEGPSEMEDYPYQIPRVYTEDESNPEYYNTAEFVFIGLTPVMYNPETFEPTKGMLFRSIEGGNTVTGPTISIDHPMWNYEAV
jgi:hypothetical protein